MNSSEEMEFGFQSSSYETSECTEGLSLGRRKWDTTYDDEEEDDGIGPFIPYEDYDEALDEEDTQPSTLND